MALLVALAAPNEYAAALTPLLDALPNGAGAMGVSAPLGQVTRQRVAGQDIVVCRTGVGPINAGISLGAAFATCPDIDAVLGIGLAGSYDLTRAPLCSTWRVTEEIWPEYGLAGLATAGADPYALGFALWDSACDSRAAARNAHVGPPAAPSTDKAQPHDALTSAAGATIWDRIALTDTATAPLNTAALTALPTASSVTVAGASGTRAYANALAARSGALLENMEGFALALACQRVGIPFYEVRVISNLAGSSQGEYRAFAKALPLLSTLLRTVLRGDSYVTTQKPTE